MDPTLQIAGIVVAGFLGLVGTGVSLFTWFRRRHYTAYANLDSLYQDVLKVGIEHPDFRDAGKTKDYKKLGLPYESYAYMVWNVCETIYDRRLVGKDTTWLWVLVVEKPLHGKWFDDNCENFFKKPFREFVKRFPENCKDPDIKRAHCAQCRKATEA